MVGGGIRGESAGIVLETIAPAGSIIEAFHLFMHGYLQVGGITTGIVNGEGIIGITNIFLTTNFKGTGEVRKRADIGRSNKV
jgi:hypothetical protein